MIEEGKVGKKQIIERGRKIKEEKNIIKDKKKKRKLGKYWNWEKKKLEK